MQQIEKQLKEWRDSRNIKTFPLTIKQDMLKEVEEVRLAIRNNDIENQVEELADIAIFAAATLALTEAKLNCATALAALTLAFSVSINPACTPALD